MRRLALFYPWIYLRGGAERVILEIARRSRHRWTVFANRVDFDQTFPEFRALPNLVVLDPVPVQRSFAAVLRAAATVARQRLPLEDHDALLVISEGLGDFVTFRNHDRPVACLCLTPARPVFDPVYRRAWLARHPAARLPLRFFSAAYAWLTRRAWRHYERVFADSGEVQARIVAGGLRPAGQVEVLHPGVDAAAIRPSFTHDHSFLYAGRIKWTKNVELAIDAFRLFRANAADAGAWRLVIAGGVDAASREYVAALRERAGLDGTVMFVANPSDAELGALYGRCCALIFPSLNEDWGIVPLEAMAHGKPVLAVNRGGPTESVLNGRTGFLLAPEPAAFAAKMTWLVEHPDDATRMGAEAAARAKEYSWDAFVQRLDDYVEQHC